MAPCPASQVVILLALATWPTMAWAQAGFRADGQPSDLEGRAGGPPLPVRGYPRMQFDAKALPLPLAAGPPAAMMRRAPPSPETLHQAWATALAANQLLEAKRRGVSSAQHGLRAAEADRWPMVSVDGSYTLRDNEPAFRFDFGGLPLWTDRFAYAQDESFAFRAKLDLPLYTSGRIQDGIAAADAEVWSSKLEVEEAALDLKLQVAQEYVRVLRWQREVELAKSTVRSLESHLRDVQLLFKHEQVPVNDLLAAQLAFRDAQQASIQARSQLDSSQAAYNRRLGRRLDYPVRIAEVELEPVHEDVETLTARALRRRAAAARLRARARALDHRASSVVAASRPQVVLRGEYTLEENRFRSPEGIAALGVGVSWNVLDGGKRGHEAAALRDRAEALRRLQADLESMIALEVRQAWLHVQETRRRLDVTAEGIQQAEENVRVVRNRYASGVGIHTEVLDAETLRTQAYRNHHNATYEAVLAVLRLRHATGELNGA